MDGFVTACSDTVIYIADLTCEMDAGEWGPL